MKIDPRPLLGMALLLAMTILLPSAMGDGGQLAPQPVEFTMNAEIPGYIDSQWLSPEGWERYLLPGESDVGLWFRWQYAPRGGHWELQQSVHKNDVGTTIPGAGGGTNDATVGLSFAFVYTDILSGFSICTVVHLTATAWYPETAIEQIHYQARPHFDTPGNEHVGDSCPDPNVEF